MSCSSLPFADPVARSDATAEEELLLPDDDIAVVTELQRLSEVRRKAGITATASSDKSQSWVKQHMALAEKRHLSS